MSNSATALADLLESWVIPSGKNVTAARRQDGSNEGHLSYWRRNADAAMLLREVDQSIEALIAMGQDVSHYRQDILPLYKAVFGQSPPWKGNVSGKTPAAPEHCIRALRGLGTTLDMAKLATNIDAPTVDELKGALDEAYDFVCRIRDLEQGDRFYLFKLISEARHYLDQVDFFGSSQVRTSVTALTGEIVAKAMEADERGEVELANQGRKTAGRMARWVAIVFGTGAVSRSGELLAEAAQKGIGG